MAKIEGWMIVVGVIVIFLLAKFAFFQSIYPSNNLSWVISKCVTGGTVYKTNAPDVDNTEFCIVTPPSTFSGDGSCSQDSSPAHYTQCGTCTGTGTINSANTCSNPSCTPAWGCTPWSTCSGGTQTRTCTDSNNCGVTTGKPATSQSCTSCTPSWTCGAWSACSGGTQTRSCTDSNNCGVNTNKPATSQSCTLTCTDTDGGINVDIKGTAADGVRTYTDSCNGASLIEAACNTNTGEATLNLVDCVTSKGAGYSCQNGICAKSCNTVADTNCDGLVNDSEVLPALTKWKTQTGISDSEILPILLKWKTQARS